ncbi:MAG: DNA mismatch repair endonuclease MutL [Chitinivibrionales bacterium]
MSNRKPKSRINVLTREVVDKIAAGEVIENPSSVVKELVENSIDAGSDSITVELNNGGLSELRVVDNGGGMSPEDLRKSVVRHATSKLRSAHEISSIESMGFRGEALASIGAVSKLRIETAESDSGEGAAINCEAGDIKGAGTEPVSKGQGTTVACRDLFFNTPARMKFLRTERAESSAVKRIIEQISVPFYNIHFRCIIDGDLSLDLPSVPGVRERIAGVAGGSFAEDFIEGSYSKGGMQATVMVQNPQKAGKRARYRNTYINNRYIACDNIIYAVKEASSHFIASEYKPSWFCFLEIEPERVDINVHPSKMEVKFDNSRSVFSLVNRAVASGLRNKFDKDMGEYSAYRDDKGSIEFESAEGGSRNLSGGSEPIPESDAEQTSMRFLSISEDVAQHGDEEEVYGSSKGDKEGSNNTDTDWQLISCFQIHSMYIIAPVKNGMVIVDQHAAHERILYEEVLEGIQEGGINSQRLLFPEIIDLSSREKEAALEIREFLNKGGFDIRDFGGKTISVSSVPAFGITGFSDTQEAIKEIIQAHLDENDPDIIQSPLKRFAASCACGTAVKAGAELNREEMTVLLSKLFSCNEPYICPHGRPTIVRYSLSEISRRFLR